MKEYKFRTKKLPDNYDLCLEQCQIKDCMIGSIDCQKCQHCKEVDKIDFKWIKCEVLDKAIGGEESW